MPKCTPYAPTPHPWWFPNLSLFTPLYPPTKISGEDYGILGQNPHCRSVVVLSYDGRCRSEAEIFVEIRPFKNLVSHARRLQDYDPTKLRAARRASRLWSAKTRLITATLALALVRIGLPGVLIWIQLRSCG